MLANLPAYIVVMFMGTTLLTIWFFSKAAAQNRTVWLVLLGWISLQGIVGYSGFFRVTDTLPPHFTYLALPLFLLMPALFFTPAGRRFTDSLNITWLTYLHVVRIPVEIVLLTLYLRGDVPRLMTFEGRNFDILAGITAPLVAYYGFRRQVLGRKFLLAWNFISYLLLLNIVVNALLSAPFRFQQFAFDQPNVAILYFPFVWLPGCIVPLVMYAHLAVIRRLLYPAVALAA